jgi:hypothetical protein
MMSTSARTNPYYIVCPPFVRTSAGIKSMHLMAHHLVDLGFEAHLHSPGINSSLQAPLLTRQTVLQHGQEGRTPIVIYSETLWGNPLRANCVVRYAGNFLGLLGGPTSFPSKELMLWHSRDLAGATAEDEKVLVLSVPTTDTTIFHPPSTPQERTLTCYYASKLQDFFGGKAADYFTLPQDSIEISRDSVKAQSAHEIAEIFRRSKVFYAFENTALSLEAMLCGCPVQLIPNPYFTKPLDVEPIGRRGMAWGFDPAEQKRARETLEEVPEAFEESRRHYIADLRHFAEASQRHSQLHPQNGPIRLVQPYACYTAADNKFGRLLTTIKALWAHYGIMSIPLFTSALLSAKSWKRAKKSFRMIEMAPGVLESKGQLQPAVDRLFFRNLQNTATSEPKDGSTF